MDNAEQATFFTEELMDDIIREIYEEQKDKVDDKYVNKKLFARTKEVLNEAVDEGYGVDTDRVFSERLKHSTDVLATFKAYEEGQTLVASAMLDEDGNLAEFGEYRKKAKEIAPKWQENWLRTEYDTAVIRAQQAAEWEQFKENADVMPNLRWMPTSSATPREQHKVFWANELTLPVDDEFWNSHRPGDLWNCKCWLMQTDEPATKKGDIPSGGNVPKPAPGLKGNPGKTGEIFSADHNFMPDACANCFLNRDGKVHGIGGAFDAEGGRKKGNCMRCTESTHKSREIAAHVTTDEELDVLRYDRKFSNLPTSNIINEGVLKGIDITKLDKALCKVMEGDIKKAFTLSTKEEAVLLYKSSNVTINLRFMYEDGRKTLCLEKVFVKENQQKKGISKSILNELYAQSKSMATDRIKLCADNKLGGYVWAKFGFYCKDRSELVLQNINEEPLFKDIVEEYYKTHKDSAPFPMRLLTQKEGSFHILKEKEWIAIIDVNDIEMTEYFENYISIP